MDALADSFREILEAVGEDPERQGLLRTPTRAARAFEFLTQGYRQSVEEIVNDAIFDSDASEIVLVKDIELYSMCETPSSATVSVVAVTLLTFQWPGNRGFRSCTHRCRCLCPPFTGAGETLTTQVAGR